MEKVTDVDVRWLPKVGGEIVAYPNLSGDGIYIDLQKCFAADPAAIKTALDEISAFIREAQQMTLLLQSLQNSMLAETGFVDHIHTLVSFAEHYFQQVSLAHELFTLRERVKEIDAQPTSTAQQGSVERPAPVPAEAVASEVTSSAGQNGNGGGNGGGSRRSGVPVTHEERVSAKPPP